MAAQLNRPTLSTQRQVLLRESYTVIWVSAGVVDYKATNETAPYAVNGNPGDVWNIQPGTVEAVWLDASTPTANVLLFPGWVQRVAGTQVVSGPAGGLVVAAFPPGLVILPSLGSVPFPIGAPLSSAVVTDNTPLAGETWALDSVANGPSAGATAVFSVFANAAKTSRIIPDIPLPAAGQAPVALQGLEVIAPNVVEINVSVAGANTGRAVVSGRRVA